MGRIQKDGSVHVISARPVVKDYNINMGAINENDQLKKSYASDRKPRGWGPHFLASVRHLQGQCICYVPAVLPKVEQWPYGRRPSSVQYRLTKNIPRVLAI